MRQLKKGENEVFNISMKINTSAASNTKQDKFLKEVLLLCFLGPQFSFVLILACSKKPAAASRGRNLKSTGVEKRLGCFYVAIIQTGNVGKRNM